MAQLKSSLPSFASNPSSTIYQKRRKRRWSIPELARRAEVEPDLIRHCERTGTLPEPAIHARLEAALVMENEAPLPPLTVKVTKRTNQYSKSLREAFQKIT